MLEILVYLVLSYAFLGLAAVTIMLELENVKRNKDAKNKTWKGWALSERE